MSYQVGDQVIHWSHGPGVITGLDEKCLSGETRLFYVVEMSNSTIWVPADDAGEKSLHLPIPDIRFMECLEILNDPGDELPEDRSERQKQLAQRIKIRSLEDICAIIRDLVSRSRTQKLNRYDSDILNRAMELLLNEWEFSLGTPRANAQRKLHNLLGLDLAHTT